MRTIIDNAESVLETGMKRANDRRRTEFIAGEDDSYVLFTFKSYVLHEARSNPYFFKWLFDDPSVTFFGISLMEAQKEEYYTWLHDL